MAARAVRDLFEKASLDPAYSPRVRGWGRGPLDKIIRLLDFAGVLMFEANREHQSQPWIDRHARKVLGALGELERIYANGRPGNLPVDLGDIAVVTTLDLLEFVVADGIAPDIEAMRWRGQYPGLTALVEKLDQRPSFAATMPEHMEFRMSDTVA